MATAQEIIDVAVKEIGTKEFPANSNRVKYNTWFYNSSEVEGSAYPWCAVYVSWCFNQVDPKLCKKSASCMNIGQWFKDNNMFYTSDPQPGDVVFFKFNTNARWTNHVGIVEKIKSDGTLITIEGNTSLTSDDNGGAVMRRNRKLTHVVGYGRPNYDGQTYKKGIDVSKYQKNIDWRQAKADGIQFGILKVIQKDNSVEPTFEQHYNAMMTAGVPCIGVYNYIYATTVLEARRAANAVLATLKGRPMKVWMDVEDESLQHLGADLIKVIEAYRKIIEGGKHEFGIYSSMSFIKGFILPYATRQYDYWVARYYNGYNIMDINDPINQAKKPDIPGIKMWQYTSSGKIDGIDGRVDVNILYD